MAYSSVHPFVNDIDVPETRRSDGAVKRYESASDVRAWSNDPLEKSTFIHEVVKRPATSNQLPCGLSEAVKDFNVVPKDELVERIKCLCKEIKTKDVELDKIHKLFKQTTRKLENMNDILKANRKFEQLLKESQTKLEKLKNEQEEKDQKLSTLEKQVSELKCSPSAQIEVDDAWETIKNRADLYDDVVKERNALKEQLCKLSGVEDRLKKLKTRADEADALEQEISNLRREMQKFGASGDVVSRNQVRGGGCSQCNILRAELQQKNAILDNETKRNIQVEAERNVLRMQVRGMDLMEAEYILYKTKYDEAVEKLMELKETLVRAEMCEIKVRECKKNFEEVQRQLLESNRHAEELINVIERQEYDLRERDVYIDCITQRLQQDPSTNALKKVLSAECVQPGSVQKIVKQLSGPATSTNCKCGIENCECLNIAPKSSTNIPKKQKSIQFGVPETSSSAVEVFKNKKELSEENSQLSIDEIRSLRQQNAELESELKKYKKELAEMTEILNQLENERKSNCKIEEELSGLKKQHEESMDCLRSSFESSCSMKDEEICCLRNKLQEEFCKVEKLEKKLAESCNELQKLRGLREKFENVCEKLKGAEADAVKLQSLQNECDKYCNMNEDLKKKIEIKEKEISEQRRYSDSLAEQISNRASQKEKSFELTEKHEMLIKSIKELKKQFDICKNEKVELIEAYEKKIQTLSKGGDVCGCECCLVGCEDVLLKKAAKCGVESLKREELVDLHNRVRCAMMKIRNCDQQSEEPTPVTFYTRMADEIRVKHNFDDICADLIPTKDVDSLSSKTMPSLLRPQPRRPILKDTTKKNPRARSTESSKVKKSAVKIRSKN